MKQKPNLDMIFVIIMALLLLIFVLWFGRSTAAECGLEPSSSCKTMREIFNNGSN